MIELRLLRYFVAVAETEHVGRAAEQLHVSQSPLSRQIRQLEEMLGVPLFERDGRRIRLTLAGKNLVAPARDLLGRADAFVRDARAITAGRARIAIGFVGTALATGVLPAGIRKLRARHAGIEVVLRHASSDVQLALVRDGELDVALVGSVTTTRELRATRVLEQPYRLAVARDSALAKTPLTSRVLGAAAWIGIRAGERSRARWFDACAAAGFEPRIAVEVDNYASALALVDAGMGVAAMPASHGAAAPAGVVMRALDRVDLAAGALGGAQHALERVGRRAGSPLGITANVPTPGLVAVWMGRVPIAVPIEVGERAISIGREGNVAIDDPRLSRHHVEVALAGGRWMIRDLDSHNGTFIDGLLLRKPMQFAEGELRVVRVGDTLLVPHPDLAAVAGGDANEAGIVVGTTLSESARAIRDLARVHVVGERGSGKQTAARHALGGDVEVIALEALHVDRQRELAKRDRLITSSRLDPHVLAATGALVPELAHELGVIIAVPPLRERPHELPHFALAALATRSAKLAAHAGLIEQVLARSWPGNARELFAEVGEAAGIAIANKHDVVTAEHLAGTAGVTASGMITPVQPIEAPNPDE